MSPRHRQSGTGFPGSRLLIACAMAVVAVGGYYGIRANAPAPGASRPAHGITPQQEMAIGLQAAPAMAQRYGGLSADQPAQRRVDRVCHDLVEKTEARRSPYDFDCHLLADPHVAAAFALPGGQVFLTTGLLAALPTDADLAAVLGREIGHILVRHGTERIAALRIGPALTGASVLAAYDPGDPASRRKAAILIGPLLDLRYSREETAEAQRLGERLAAEAGYGRGESGGGEALHPREVASTGR